MQTTQIHAISVLLAQFIITMYTVLLHSAKSHAALITGAFCSYFFEIKTLKFFYEPELVFRQINSFELRTLAIVLL